MPAPSSLSLRLETKGGDTAITSVESVLAALGPARQAETGERLAQFICSFLNGGGDDGNLFRGEFTGNAAGGAIELVGLKILPSERYLELVAAFAVEREDVSLRLVHGWPILSVGSVAAPTVAEAAGESILGGEGSAA